MECLLEVFECNGVQYPRHCFLDGGNIVKRSKHLLVLLTWGKGANINGAGLTSLRDVVKHEHFSG